MKAKYSLGTHELKSADHRLWQALIGEFLGNFILNFFGVGACTQQMQDHTFKSLAFGLGVFIAITTVGQLSGGHVNPAVTLAMLLVGRVSLLRAFLYVFVQCLGATAGAFAIKTMVKEYYYDGLGHTTLAEGITPLQGLGMEFCLGLVLVLTFFGATDVNKPDAHSTAPFAIGMTVTLGHLGTISYTGASMNPARTLGTAIVADSWDDHWIYWVGPISGGIVAALIYTQVLEQPTAADSIRDHGDVTIA